jgi:hypothetical protein
MPAVVARWRSGEISFQMSIHGTRDMGFSISSLPSFLIFKVESAIDYYPRVVMQVG